MGRIEFDGARGTHGATTLAWQINTLGTQAWVNRISIGIGHVDSVIGAFVNAHSTRCTFFGDAICHMLLTTRTLRELHHQVRGKFAQGVAPSRLSISVQARARC